MSDAKPDFTSACVMYLKTNNSIDNMIDVGMRQSLMRAINGAAEKGYYHVVYTYGCRLSADNNVNVMITDLKKAGYIVHHSIQPKTDTTQILIHTFIVSWDRDLSRTNMIQHEPFCH